MTLLHCLPEIYLLTLLFITLTIINFRWLTYHSLSIFIAGFASIGLIYFVCRPDLAYFNSPIKMLFSDSLSFFGKILSLISLVVFSLGFHFHRNLTFKAKQNSNLFLLFFSIFTIGLFQANNLIFFLGSALGIYLSSMNLILIESDRDPEWVSLFRQRMLPYGFWAIIIGLLFAVGTFLFGSVYTSDWILALSKYSGGEIGLFIFAFLILMGSAIPLGGLRYQGRAPLGIAILCYSLFLVLTAFWLRVGVPFFSLSSLFSKNVAQVLLSVVLGGFALRYAWHTIRTRDHDRWLAAALPTSVGLSLFLVLLSGEQALPAFYSVSLSLLFTFALISHAFLDDEYRHKGVLVLSLVALIGAPPLILGEQYYRMIRDAVTGGNLAAGILMMLSWFALTVAAMQMVGKILLVRNSTKVRRKVLFSEYFFLGIYLLCVISLTAFRPALVSLLNEHPVLNLW